MPTNKQTVDDNHTYATYTAFVNLNPEEELKTGKYVVDTNGLVPLIKDFKLCKQYEEEDHTYKDKTIAEIGQTFRAVTGSDMLKMLEEVKYVLYFYETKTLFNASYDSVMPTTCRLLREIQSKWQRKLENGRIQKYDEELQTSQTVHSIRVIELAFMWRLRERIRHLFEK